MPTPAVTSPNPTGRPSSDPGRRDDRLRPPDRRWSVLVVVALAQLMIVLDTTIINVALPSVQADLDIADGRRPWLVTAYALAFGSLLLLGGRISDRLGRKRTLIGALVLFALASAAGGAASSFGVLVGARAVQGVAAAMLAPAALSTLVSTFSDPRERARAFSIFASVAVGGGAVGLLLGGALTEHLSWRWTMYINVPIAAASALAAGVLMTHHRPADRARIDLVGAMLVTAGLFAVVFGFSHAEGAGWTSAVTLTCLTAGAALLIAFGFAERRVLAPLLPPPVVSDRSRAVAFVALAIASFAMFGLFLFLTYYLQTVRGYRPLLSGAAFLPMIAALVVSAQVSTTLTLPRYGPRVVITTGMTVGALALGYLSRLDVASSYTGGVLPALVGMGLGMGMIVAPSMTTATAGVHPRDAGVASALVNAMQQVGGCIGTAVLSTIAATATAAHAPARSGAGTETAAAVVARAATHGFGVAFAISAGAFAAGALMAASLFPSRTRAIATPPSNRGGATEDSGQSAD